MTPAMRNVYALAERLGVFVHDIQTRMPLKEYYGWLNYYSELNKQTEQPEVPDKVATDEDILRFFGEHPVRQQHRQDNAAKVR